MDVGRNAPCPCGSGRKFKQCHGRLGPAAPAPATSAELQQALQHHRTGQLPQAEALYRRVLAREPDNFNALNLLGALACQVGQFGPAAELLVRAIRANPASPDAHNNLGAALKGVGRLAEAEAALRRAIELRPDLPNALANLGAVLTRQGRYGEALETLWRALRQAPDHVESLFNLASAQKECGLIPEAVDGLRRVTRLRPQLTEAWCNLLLTLQYDDRIDAAALLEEHRRYDAAVAERLGAPAAPPLRDPDPGRRLRIGFVSPDFHAHSVAWFFEPLLAHRSRDRVEAWCYYNNVAADGVTKRLRGLADQWVPCAAMSDEQLAERIRADGIDVLVDLAGYTGGRTQLFARRPAPVQVAWLGYPASTGLAAMGWRVTDALADPPEFGALGSERLLRMPASYFCYQPPTDAPGVSEPPAIENGFVTFGSFNNLAKVTPTTLGLWAAVLERVPGARLLVKAKALGDPGVRTMVQERFRAAGVEPARLTLTGWQEQTASHLAVYQQVDIALDTFPYNGATTTCEALWMGVPVVSLAGERSASRMGASILDAAGFGRWVADAPQAFVERAARLAAEPDALRIVRAGLREGLRSSALLDAPRFARAFEGLLRQAWRETLREAPRP